jgi:hypothetical protein
MSRAGGAAGGATLIGAAGVGTAVAAAAGGGALAEGTPLVGAEDGGGKGVAGVPTTMGAGTARIGTAFDIGGVGSAFCAPIPASTEIKFCGVVAAVPAGVPGFGAAALVDASVAAAVLGAAPAPAVLGMQALPPRFAVEVVGGAAAGGPPLAMFSSAMCGSLL